MNDPVDQALQVAIDRVSPWLSAALEDPTVCAEMNIDIQAWFTALDRGRRCLPEGAYVMDAHGWVSIDEALPLPGIPLFYYFAVFERSYLGTYWLSRVDIGDTELYEINSFGGNMGVLSDDVTWWQYAPEGASQGDALKLEKPEGPCKYHREPRFGPLTKDDQALQPM